MSAHDRDGRGSVAAEAMRLDGGLRHLFREQLPVVHWQSIETGGTGRGVPDSNGCYRGHEFWIEFKWTKGHVVSLRPEQIGWLTRRARSGGKVFVAVRRTCATGPRRTAADELYLLRGSYARELRERGLTDLPTGAVVGSWGGGPGSWAWGDVLEALITSA